MNINKKIKGLLKDLPDELYIHIMKYVQPFKSELLNFNYKKYFTFYITSNKEIYMIKKWMKFKTRKPLLLIRSVAGGGCIGLGIVYPF